MIFHVRYDGVIENSDFHMQRNVTLTIVRFKYHICTYVSAHQGWARYIPLSLKQQDTKEKKSTNVCRIYKIQVQDPFQEYLSSKIQDTKLFIRYSI